MASSLIRLHSFKSSIIVGEILHFQIVQQFRKFATLHNVHVTLVIHPRKEDDERLTANSIFGGAKATQEADNVILLQEEEINLKQKRKFIQVRKRKSILEEQKRYRKFQKKRPFVEHFHPARTAGQLALF